MFVCVAVVGASRGRRKSAPVEASQRRLTDVLMRCTQCVLLRRLLCILLSCTEDILVSRIGSISVRRLEDALGGHLEVVLETSWRRLLSIFGPSSGRLPTIF